jgi:molybdopterin-guanine dinucleotide biosynthesis protein A
LWSLQGLPDYQGRISRHLCNFVSENDFYKRRQRMENKKGGRQTGDDGREMADGGRRGKSLARPDLGRFGPSEWAILGTVCGNIQSLAAAVGERLVPEWKVAYIDADHKQADASEGARPFSLEWTDKIGFQRLDFAQTPNQFEQRALLHDQDLVLINGNHFEGRRQIVALDRRKSDSLSRKINRLTEVDLFLTKQDDPNFIDPKDIPDFLKNHLPHWAQIPVLDWSAPDAIADFLKQHTRMAPIKGLVLAGGQSTRMGQDKAAMAYHHQPHWAFTKALLQSIGVETVISCRQEQADAYGGENVMPDTFTGLGPFGAILSAFRHDPNAAWLVLPCDLPLINHDTLKYLISHRNPLAPATAFAQPQSPDIPEPLIAIWEPKIYARMLQFLAQGVNAPLEVLTNAPTVHLLEPPDPKALVNVNTPDDRDAVLREHFPR